MASTTLIVKTSLKNLYDDSVRNVDHTTSRYVRLSLSTLDRIICNERKSSVLWDDPTLVRWVDYIYTHERNLVSLSYRFSLLKHICTEPVLYHKTHDTLLKCLDFMTLTEVEFHPLYDCDIWNRIDPNETLITQLQILSPEIRQHCDTLANRLDVTDNQLQRDHAMLSSYSLLYCLYLISVMLTYETKLGRDNINQAFLEGTLYTIDKLKDVLLHTFDE